MLPIQRAVSSIPGGSPHAPTLKRAGSDWEPERGWRKSRFTPELLSDTLNGSSHLSASRLRGWGGGRPAAGCSPCFPLGFFFSAEWRFCIEYLRGGRKHTHTKLVHSQENPPICSWGTFLSLLLQKRCFLIKVTWVMVRIQLFGTLFIRNMLKIHHKAHEFCFFFSLKTTTRCAPPGSSSLLSCLSLESSSPWVSDTYEPPHPPAGVHIPPCNWSIVPQTGKKCTKCVKSSSK